MPRSSDTTDATLEATPPDHVFKPTHVVLVLVPICFALFASALEQTAVSTALPTIVDSLGDFPSGDFIWAGSCYSLAAAAFLPMSGAFAQIFGRKQVMISILTIFSVGSALCGAASSRSIFLLGRTVQGMGGGGIASLANLIVADLVPLSERGKYNALLGVAWSLASAVGPVLGGALAQRGAWRWLFYLNIPLCTLIGLAIWFLLNLKTPHDTLKEKVRRIDWIGNFIIVASTASAVIGLTWGGVAFPWTSFRVLLPLCLGFSGMAGFIFYEKSYPAEPTVPHFLLTNRTTLSGYIQTLLLNCCVLAFVYYLPVYFQACKLATPTASGLDLLGLTLSLAPISILVGFTVAKYQCYRPQLWVGWSLMMVSMGLLSTLTASTPLWRAIGYSILTGSAMGTTLTATLYPILAPLPVSANAPAIALSIFLRVFGQLWGITIGGAVLQNGLKAHIPQDLLLDTSNTGDLTYAAIALVRGLEGQVRGEVQQAFALALASLWRVMLYISAAAFLISLMMRDIPMHTHTDTTWVHETNSSPQSDSEKDAPAIAVT
ncbi:major facilitator superfamily domain-containing protein [Mycena epipterygia]|nr:major facilitator superfamily domain-containing protein [Mycena epipterygia]